MFHPLKKQLVRKAKQLQIHDKLNEHNALDRAHRMLEELAGEGSAKPTHIKNGILFVKCKNPTTAHFLRMREERIKLVAQVSSVRFLS